MKKIIALVLVLIMAAACLTACGAKGATLKDVQKAGKLTVATSPDFPPFESLEGGEVVGIEIDILKLICDDLGVELEIVQMDFDSVLVAIQSAKYDCAASGITVDADRQKNMLFTDPYYNAAQVIVVKEGSPIQSKADLEGKTVSVQTGTTAESGCRDEGIDIQAYTANADAKAALTTDKVDAWVVDNLTAMQMVEEGDGLVILDEKMTEEPYAFAFAFGSEDLVKAINESLTKLIEDGTVESIFASYGEEYVKP
ncbi:MAG: transporter substrate-binding domain-containing protein [Oscillospiraceae bacterium]|nr:transporter substrate-binding domain-containing protein [Oscillospiraceae bacterium]